MMIEKICLRCEKPFLIKWHFQKYCGSKRDINSCSGKIQREQVLKAGRKWRKAHPEYNARWRKQMNEPQRKLYLETARRYYHNNKERENRLNLERSWRIKSSCIEALGGKCSICGYNKNIVALDFHHCDNSNKEYDGEWKKKAFQQKIKNGEILLLCANCHREIHHPHRTPENMPQSEIEACKELGCKIVYGVGGVKVESSSRLVERLK